MTSARWDAALNGYRELRLEATPDGHIAVELLRACRRHSAGPTAMVG